MRFILLGTMLLSPIIHADPPVLVKALSIDEIFQEMSKKFPLKELGRLAQTSKAMSKVVKEFLPYYFSLNPNVEMIIDLDNNGLDILSGISEGKEDTKKPFLKISVKNATQDNIDNLLEKCGLVTSLSFRKNLIRDASAQAIAQSETLKNLTTLYLGLNKIGDAGAQAIARSATLKNLTALKLK